MSPTPPDTYAKQRGTYCDGCGQRVFRALCADGGIRWVATFTGRLRCHSPRPVKNRSKNPAKQVKPDWGHRVRRAE